MNRILLLTGLFTGLVASGTADARTVRAREPASVVAVLKKAGYPADLTNDDAGDPMINSRRERSDFTVHFYGCVDNRNCTRVQFLFTLSDPGNGTIEALNAWNAESYFGRAYRTEAGVARLEMDVDLDDGGMSSALFEDNIEWWALIMDDFAKHVRGS